MILNRRELLRRSGEGAILLAGLSLFSSCGGVTQSDFRGTNGSRDSIKGVDRDDLEILYLASLAPSGHNTQPWTVRLLEPKHWIIGSEKKRWLPAVDPENRELLLGVGAFIENLVIAAGTFGYAVDIEILAKSPKDTEIADLRLTKGKAEPFPLEKIKTRRTVRNGFLDEEIKAEDLKYIMRHDTRMCPAVGKSGASFPRHSFYFPKSSPQARYLQEGTIEANRKQAFRDPGQEELANWIRWSNREAREHCNGLTPESMEIKGIAGLYVRTFYDRQSVLKKSFREQTVDIAAKQAKAGGGWLVVTSQDSSIPTLIEYGRVFENMLLKIRDKMIALHPMTQMLEEDPWRQGVAKGLGLEGQVQWILRIGYLKSYPEPVSLRMPVSWFVKT